MHACNLLWGHRQLVHIHTNSVGDRVGLRVLSDGALSFFVNGKSQGVAAKHIHKQNHVIYPAVDVCERCYAVRSLKQVSMA